VRILYSATDQVVPGDLGGSVHVRAVAEGLARLGHEVHVAVRIAAPLPSGGLFWHPVAPPLASARLRLLCSGALMRLAREIQPDVVMERYHNFGGEGVLAARRTHVPLVLEVNAPVIDYPGSAKHVLDRALIVEPMRRWREWQCRRADLFGSSRSSGGRIRSGSGRTSQVPSLSRNGRGRSWWSLPGHSGRGTELCRSSGPCEYCGLAGGTSSRR
jgi:hypothetical protein